MWKRSLKRALSSMGICCMTSQVIALVTELLVNQEGFVPLTPSYLLYFDSVTLAMGTSILLTGLIGAAFGGFSVVFEMEKWSFLKQGIVHFLLTTAVWLPVSIFLWGMERYPRALVGVLLSFAATYAITWWMNYMRCRAAINTINEKLEQMRGDREKEKDE